MLFFAERVCPAGIRVPFLKCAGDVVEVGCVEDGDRGLCGSRGGVVGFFGGDILIIFLNECSCWKR